MKKRVLVLSLLVLLLAASFNTLAYELPYNDDDVDFGGATVTFVGWWDPREEFIDGKFAGRLEEAMERYNIGDIQYLSVEWGDPLRETMLNRLMSDESQNDLWILPQGQIWPMIASNAFYPMNEVLPDAYYEGLTNEARGIVNAFSYGGEKYPLGSGTGAVQTIKYIVWNKDIFSAEGLPELGELYLNDEWTWDKFEEIAIAATTDTDGDGEVDQWGSSDIEPIAFGFANGAEPVVENEDGELVFGYTDEAAFYHLRKMREWKSEMDFVQGDWQHLEFQAGQVAMAPMDGWQIADDAFQDTVEFDYGIVPLPKGPNADEYGYPSGADAFFVPVNAENPKGLAALNNFLFRPEEIVDEREDFVISAARDQVSYQVLMEAYEKWDGDIFAMAGIIGEWYQEGTPFGDAVRAVIYEGQSPASAMEAAAPEIQIILDEQFND
ncbi:MAG: ABC transporter substrate-binding protein [Halanaerobiales bacterium]